ncbi:MAG TPA: hypothetical protein VFV41_10390 [Streptosporangiaceae bacterium]|nr:hypothetical protein [Streptosporangiaceae bacterium]
MCSITGDGTDELGRLGRAIDDLADAVAAQQAPRAAQPATEEPAGPGGAGQAGAGQDAQATSPGLTMQELATRLAAIWRMVAELDPELARRLARYER